AIYVVGAATEATPVRLQAYVEEAEGGAYKVYFQIGASVPVQTQSSRGATSTSVVTYTNVDMQTSVLLQPGRPMEILRGNVQAITATLTVPDGPVAPAAAPDPAPVMDSNLKLIFQAVGEDGVPINFSALLAGSHLDWNPIIATTKTNGVDQPAFAHVGVV